jgi:hypothetical protein
MCPHLGSRLVPSIPFHTLPPYSCCGDFVVESKVVRNSGGCAWCSIGDRRSICGAYVREEVDEAPQSQCVIHSPRRLDLDFLLVVGVSDECHILECAWHKGVGPYIIINKIESLWKVQFAVETIESNT